MSPSSRNRIHNADDATRLAIELRVHLEATNPPANGASVVDLRETVREYVGALRLLGLTFNEILAALGAVLSEAGFPPPLNAEAPRPTDRVREEVIAWCVEPDIEETSGNAGAALEEASGTHGPSHRRS
ncbi:MAG TPA: hypothetical protein VGQ44_08865 [Gemmatimonadaceae bacterium]|jgi:hypothetical protein|nr:hypothetical protein [Gemmatimonadaceae bacterium]